MLILYHDVGRNQPFSPNIVHNFKQRGVCFMNILSKFPERLAERMQDMQLKPVDLANRIGISRNTVTRYLQGVRLPSYDTLSALVQELDCSADFLLGIEDTLPEHPQYLPIPPFSTRFRVLLEQYGLTQYALHHKTGFSYDNFRNWLRGTTAPYPDNLIRLAQALDCSVDVLMGHSAE